MPHTEGVPAHAEEHHRHHTVKIYIDRVERTSPTPTTGSALYTLGSVPEGYVLFREVQGHRDDELVPRSDAHIHLTEWEHFYSAQGKLNPGSVA